MSTTPPPTLCMVPLSDLTPRTYFWLWLYRLALGKLALLDGDPEQAKTFLALDLCARLTTGRPMPDGTPGLDAGNVVILKGEDTGEDTLLPRLQALGGDPSRVFLIHQQTTAGDELIRFPAHIDLLDQALKRSRARLVVIDPIMAFLDHTVNAASDASVRRMLQPIQQVAEYHQAAVLLSRHLNKAGRGRSIYRGLNSIAFSAFCRSEWLLGRDPEDSNRRVLAQVKNNLAPPQPSLAFELLAHGDGPPLLNWLGSSPWNVNQLLAAVGAKPPRVTPRDNAADFLTAFLLDGPRLSRDIWTAAQPRGFTARTLQRARKGLDIKSLRVCVDGKTITYWLWPGQQLPESVASAAAGDLEPWLAPLRAEFPPPTPLDDPD